MTLLPIVYRELRVAARRKSTYWIRSGAALALVALGTWFFLMMRREGAQMLARTLFTVLTGCAVLYALLSGLRATADCLSEEKREGTFGLLFLTDLKGYDIILGKLAANSVNAFYSVLAVVPMLAIPLLIGGVTVGEFERMALVAGNTLFWSLALGMFVSAMSRSAQRASSGTLLVILLLAAGVPACGPAVAFLRHSNQVAVGFLVPSPGFNYYMAHDFVYRLRPQDFWYSAITIHGVGWVALVLASVIAPRSWQDRPVGAQRVRWLDRWKLWAYGKPSERAVFRKRLLDQNAFFWLASRVRAKPAYVWGAFGLVVVVWICGVAKYGRGWFGESAYLITAMTVNVILRSWFASEASRQLAEDRKSGTLELLLSTPLEVRDILEGQWLALQRQFLGPVAVAIGVELLFMFATLSDVGIQDDRMVWAAFWMCLIIMLVADLVGLYWLGMWMGLTAKTPSQATSASVSVVFVIPWGIIALLILLIALAGPAVGNAGGADPSKFMLGLWFFVGIVVDLVAGGIARNNLLERFRLIAQQRYSSSASVWKRFLGGTGAEISSRPGVARE